MATSSSNTTPNGATNTNDSSSNSMNEDIQHVLELMVSKSRGQVGTNEVEHAVSQLLQKTNHTAPATTDVQPDLDDYDDIEAKPTPQPSKQSISRTTPFPQATLQDMIQNEEHDNSAAALLDDIPLGRAGAKMMVTFGDGPHPQPAAVSAALLGARQLLQMSIKDARALRRSQKIDYLHARQIAMLSSKDGKLKGKLANMPTCTSSAVGPEMMYRAMQGWDKLAYDPKCGFDVEQLRQLFPEEMQAYSRWKEMHKEYKEKTSDDDDTTASTTELDGSTASEEATADNVSMQNKSNSSSATDVPVADGHLEERAAQFDVRTDYMEKDWYLKFSEVRRGSFLPKGMKKASEREWNDKRKKPRGRPKAGNWESMTATSVRFLHWVGFDPRSALPPPNEEVTEALAFLAYDFMGRIVEKAIYLKNIENQEEDSTNPLLELCNGQQLEAADIEKAINDSTIRPVPLYSSLDKPVAAQLYFGPGFEDRLEMEMEELASSKRKRLSPEELEIRRREDELFGKLQEAPPAFDGFQNVLDEEEEDSATTAARDDSSAVTVPSSNNKKKKTATKQRKK